MPRILATVAALALASAAAAVEPTFRNVPYARVGTRDLLMDIYIPTVAAPPYPVVVRIHGGGWSGGSNYPVPNNYQQLLSRGFVIASPSYRLTSQTGQYGVGVPVTFPAQIHDIKGAVRYLRANAALYSIDADRIGAMGESAGGHLTALLATSAGVADAEGTVGGNLAFSSTIQAAADFFGPTDLLNINLDVTSPPGSTINHDAPSSPESRLLGWSGAGQGVGNIRANLTNPNPPYPALVALAHLVNPITHVNGDEPPFFIAHGGMDTSVPLNQSQRLADALAAADLPFEFRINPAAGHGAQGIATDRAAITFFLRTFKNACRPDFDGDGDSGTDDDIDAFFACIGGNCCPTCGSADFDADGDTGTDSDIEAFFRVLGGGPC